MDDIRLTLAPRTWEMDASIDGPMDVPYDDWPASLRDGIDAAAQTISERFKVPTKVVYAEYKRDHDLAKEAPGYHYVHVIISEVVMGDERTIDHDRIMAELPDEVKRLLN